MKLQLEHDICYEYESPVSLGPHQLLVRPRETPLLRLPFFSLQISPEARLAWCRDHNENIVARAYFRETLQTVLFQVRLEAETLDLNPFDFIIDPEVYSFPFTYTERQHSALLPFLGTTEETAHAKAWVDTCLPSLPDESLELLLQLNSLLRNRIAYTHRYEDGIQTVAQTLASAEGSCRDVAFLFLHIVRAYGFASRFVSGYFYDPPSEGGGTAGHLHAWTEVFLPGAGWKGFDPTNGILCNDRFLPLAVGRIPDNLNPVIGQYYGNRHIPSRMTSNITMREVS